MCEIISPEVLLDNDRKDSVILDVRSPGEYEQGHIPGSVSFPLFLNDERAEVGFLYKQQGPESALEHGLNLVGPRMSEMVSRAKELSRGAPLIVHCWRGGKRSASVGWLLDMAGLKVSVLEGGYKAYRAAQRKWASTKTPEFIVLGGKTGSGKTDILQELSQKNQQVLDLEGLANHKGSAFGWIGENPQPSNEHFENLVFTTLSKMDPGKPVWVENESRSIGRVFIPDILWEKILLAPVINIEVPLDARVRNLVATYSDGTNLEALKSSFNKIEKRLGGQHLKAALDALKAGDLATAAEIALVYYDKAYIHGLEKRRPSSIHNIDATNLDLKSIEELILKAADVIFTESLISRQ